MKTEAQSTDDWSNPEAKAQQSRSKQTYENLIHATFDLLKDRPFEQITVVDIAEQANCSPGTINRRFGSKEKLVDVVYERLADRANTVLDQLLNSIDLGQTSLAVLLETVLSAYQAFVKEYRLIFRAGYTRVLTSPDTNQKIMRMRAQVVTKIAEAVLQSKHNIRHNNPKLAVEFAILQGMAVLTELIEGGDLMRHINTLDEATVIGELKISLLRYLGEQA